MNKKPNPQNFISLRKFPYPYKAGFSICSDIDGTTFEDFVTIHSFLNSKKDTPLGQGLGLELSDSFWFYSHRNTPDHAFCYFNEDNKTPSKYAPVIREFIRSGHIDTLHSYGNFSRFGGFSRKLAERCLEELDKTNLKLETWVNHGDKHNSQNIGFAPYHLGDKPVQSTSSTCDYHTDLLVKAGFTYFWDSETSLTKVIGQNRQSRWHEGYFNPWLAQKPLDRLRMLAKFASNIWKRKEKITFQNNRLLNQVELADGNSMFHFKRYGSGRYDWSDDLPLLIHSDMLNRLVDNEGASILYVHWGDRKIRSAPLPFSPATVQAFNYLATLHENDSLWVTTTKRLLDYSFLIDYLNWTVEKNEAEYVINIHGHNNHDLKQKTIQIDNLQGLTFYTPQPQATIVNFEDKLLATTKNPKDESGQQSISIPLNRLEFPADVVL